MSEVRSVHSGPEFFVQNLRKQTAASHQKLEDNHLSKAILEANVTLADYQTYLSALYGVTLGCEKCVFPLIQNVIPDLNQRFRSQLIANDLRATGFPQTQIDALPVYTFTLPNVAEAMGAMYVLEGSTLGGRMLFKHINKTLGLTENNGASYFWGYGEQTGPMWKLFVTAFTQFALETEQSAAIIDSAIHTFTIIDKWLDEAENEK
ncbi:biliverdin-producing heme oxygenase [Dyadobacter sp. CY326]|uniref:biliverdin-producing heme oxygenase n=1 Tax=Dyadobacter sp. CY326 TaxID=2907300 RepID=UPI001F425914|nr:biliverdin-producing heme oxygenase [Dyadobacter sp. CY326]MCE7066255.1 biliverdin-producing heme oxygenase [Dyadobacter sp. CY326]